MSDDHKLPGDRAWDEYARTTQFENVGARHAFAAGWNARRLFDQREQKGDFNE